MKIRNGFVSNSSSSSFIVGVAKISDYNKFQERLKEIGIHIDSYELMIKSISDVRNDNIFECRYFDGNFHVESFSSSAGINVKEMIDTDLLFIVNIANNEGDNEFMDSYDGDMDYNIGLDFFYKNQQELYKMFFDEQSGLDITKCDINYGAARNG